MDDRLPREKKFSWWERRSTIEKCLLLVTSLCVIVIIYLASNLLMTFPATKPTLQRDVCMTEKCIRASANILEKIDKTVDPCEDFYKFACGNFIKDAIIPDDNVAVSPLSSISDKVDLQLMNLFEEPIRDNEPQFVKLVKKFYSSCINTTKIEQEGLSFVKREFKEFGGWPVIEPYWNEKIFDWRNFLYRFKKDGWRQTFFFRMYVDTDMKNSSRTIFTLTQPSMPYDRLKKGLNDTAVKAGYEYIIELAVLFGADRATAVADMKDVVNFEIDLAKLLIPYEERKNRTLEYNPITIRELQRNFTSLPWLKLINNFLSPIDMYTSDDVVNVATPKFFEKFEVFLLKVKKRTLANYMFSTIVRDIVDYLPDAFKRKELEYMKIVYGKNEVTPRWKNCVWEATRLHIAVSSLHVKNFVVKSTKQKVNELTIDIKSAFLDTLKKVGWMDRKTKKHALQKAERMSSFIGYPEEILDDKIIEEYYQGLELDSDEYYLKLAFNLSKFDHMKHVQALKEPLRSPGWSSQAYTFYANAFYVQTENTIELPAAILQDHFFDPDRPQYMNYGAIGEVIGHEITHGFDDHGRQYDKDGNVVDWWESETNRTFSRKSQCLVEQYGNYTVPEIEMSLNGVKTLGENIADNGGIKIAYRGYLKWLERNKPEPLLPGLPFTPRQLFWISTATNWCTKYKKETLKQMVTLGHHAPTYFRIVVPFMNSDHFGKDFNCPLGSPMNPRYKCRVW